MFTKTEKYLKTKRHNAEKTHQESCFFFWNFEHLEVKRNLG